MNDACATFGFPFENVRCCREMKCDCMEYTEKKFDLARKRQSVEGPKKAPPCVNCSHEKDKHFDLEKSVMPLQFLLCQFKRLIRLYTIFDAYAIKSRISQ